MDYKPTIADLLAFIERERVRIDDFFVTVRLFSDYSFLLVDCDDVTLEERSDIRRTLTQQGDKEAPGAEIPLTHLIGYLREVETDTGDACVSISLFDDGSYDILDALGRETACGPDIRDALSEWSTNQ